MQTLTDIRIYTGITRCDGPDVTLKSVNSVGGAELHVYTSEGERHVIEVPDGGVYDSSIQPMPQYEHACKNAASNVLATLLRGADGKGVKGGYFDEDGTLYLIMEDASEVAVGKISLENYYTKKEVDAKRLANPHALGISVNGGTVEYDGRVSISLPAIYAPLSQGGSAQVLVGGSPAPQWVDVSKLAGVKVDWSNIGSKPTTIKGYGITDCYTKTEVDPTIEKANSALQSIISPEPEDGDYVSLSVGKKTGSNTQEVRVAAHIAKLNTSADGLVAASDARAYVEQAKAEVTENIGEQGFAKDLTGVLEATPEEFTYRPSAGNRSIRDESAVIRRIKGNTVVFTLQLSDHSSALQREGDWSIAPEVTANTWGGFSRPIQVIAGHKYLFYINKKDGHNTADAYTLLKDTHRVDFDTPLFITSTETASWRWTARYQTSTNGLRFQTQAFDLTELFCAGNEPTTIEEFRRAYPNAYYPYQPEVRNVDTIAIYTVGFNQWDEQWEVGGLNSETGETKEDDTKGRSVNYFDVLPSTPYFCHTIANTTTDASGAKGAVNIVWYDSNKTFIRYQVFTNRTLTSPRNARYAKIYTVAGDVNKIFGAGICINLSHSGVRNGEYEPYAKHVRQLPEIYKYFPEGMNGNANVWDEINAEKAIKRWGVVDLGSLTWTKGATGTSGVSRWLGKGIEHLVVKTKAATDIPNIVCAKYILSSASNIWATTMPMQVSLDPTGSVLIYDSGYSYSSTTVATFTAHMQGVLLYYELAEPIETPITEAIQLDYEVYDFGTEKASAFGNSAPFRADIVYQFNAEGRIRDNSRNIERVESNIQKVERTITTSLIPSQTAMLGLPNKVMTWTGSTAMMSLPIAESIADWELEESPYEAIPTGKQVKEYISSITNRLIPSQTAMLGLPNKVMVWDGNKTLMSLPIADGLEDWGNADSTHGYLVTDQQVKKYVADVESSITDKLIPSSSATLESSNRVMVWNGNYAMTSLPIAANFAQWGAGAIPTGQQVIDYISAIKGSLATGLIPKETLTIGASGYDIISPNKVYEITTKSSTTYDYDLYLSTTVGVDVIADNEWRIRIDTRNGFSGRIGIIPVQDDLREYTIRWAYPEASGVGTAPNITTGFIYDIQFRMIGRTLLGSYKKY